MSKADEMFEKLEYSIIENSKRAFIVEIKKYGQVITFNKEYKQIEFYNGGDLYNPSSINFEELQAINEKCRELGMVR